MNQPTNQANRCSICGEPYVGFGHNAYPVNTGRCCTTCNDAYVIPERILGMLARKPPEEAKP